MKEIKCVLVILLFSCLLCFAKGAEGHSEDILYMVYGYSDYDEFVENESHDVVVSYWIVSDAVAFAVDEQGMGKQQEKYQSLKQNISSTIQGAYVFLPDYSKFISIGGGSHRAYNHQGFYYDYRDKWEEKDDGETANKYLDRWELGRDGVLIPAVAAAFNIQLEDPRAEAIAVILYYCHILGDLYEGSDRSISQMTNITTNYYMFMELESDLGRALEKCGGVSYSYFMNLSMNDYFGRVRRSVRNCRSRLSAFTISENFISEHISPVIDKLLGISSISEIHILK